MARELKIRITGDASGLRKGTDDAEGVLAQFGSKVSAWSVASGQLIADGLKTGVSTAVGFIGDSIGAATDMNETLSKVGVLFGDGAGQVEAFADKAATSLGQSKQQALDAAATFATFGKSAGLTGGDLAKFSTDFTGLASDLASFNNTSPQEAIDAIGAALRGEAEPLRRYGVLLDDASMRQKALELGIISSTKEALTPQQKVLAAQALIMAQTTAAQGDFARTSGGLANQQRILAAQFENVKAKIGQAFLPIAQAVVSFASTRLIPAFSALADVWLPRFTTALQVLTSGFRNFADGRTTGGVFGFFEQVGIYAGQVVAWFRNLIDVFRSGGWTAALAEVGRKAVDLFMGLSDWLYTTALPAIGRALAAIGQRFGTWVTDTAVPFLQANLPGWLSTLGGWLTGTVLPWLGEQALALADKLGGWIAAAAGYLAANLPGWLATFGDWYYGTALPWLGGIVLEMAGKLGGWIVDAVGYLKDNLPGWLGAFVEWATGTALPELIKQAAAFELKLVDWVLDAAVDLAKNLPGWLAKFTDWAATSALPAMVGFGKDILTKLAEGTLGADTWLWDVGKQVVQGLIDGLVAMGGKLKSAVEQLIRDNIPGPVRDILGINSPSRVFHELGVQTAQGMALGLAAGAPLVRAAASGMAGAALPGGASWSPQRYSAADLAGGSQWQPASQTFRLVVDGKDVAVALAPAQRRLERSYR